MSSVTCLERTGQQQKQQQHFNSSGAIKQQLDSGPVYFNSSKERQPRPPVPGSERSGSEVFQESQPPRRDGMGHFGGGGDSLIKSTTVGSLHGDSKGRLVAAKTNMAPSPKAASESGASGRERGFEPEGSADITPPFSESNSNNSTPAYLR
jgi:hypothetical protein